MENHNIDSIFKKAINESEDYYDQEAANAKERIWNQIQPHKKTHIKPLLFRLLAAACILLFISTSVIFIWNYNTQNRINRLVELNNKLEKQAARNNITTIINNEPIISETIISSDTVYLEKKVIVTKPIIRTQRITDTVYIQQIVYVEKEQAPQRIATFENEVPLDSVQQQSTTNYGTEIIISNNDPVKSKKRNKMRFKFGGNKDHSSKGTLALTSKL